MQTHLEVGPTLRCSCSGRVRLWWTEEREGKTELSLHRVRRFVEQGTSKEGTTGLGGRVLNTEPVDYLMSREWGTEINLGEVNYR